MGFLPENIKRAIAEMGAGAQPEINKATKALLGPLLEKYDDVIETLDISYADHPRQRMDIYSTANLKDAPVVIYIPGGGFTGGDKRQDDRFFGNVGRFFAKRGVVAVTGNYRLAPEFTWPTAAQDVASIVRWVKENIYRFGGDATKIIIFGHSAGASHAGSFVFDPELRGHEEVRGAILSSGLFVLRSSEMRPNVAQYFGSDETTFERRSALSHVAGTKIPVLLTVAEFDPVPLATPTFDLAIALTRRDGRPPKLMWLEDHNHYSCISSVGTCDTRYSGAILEFVQQVSRNGS